MVWSGMEGSLCGLLRRAEWALACTASPLGDTLALFFFASSGGAFGEAVRRMMACLGDG